MVKTTGIFQRAYNCNGDGRLVNDFGLFGMLKLATLILVLKFLLKQRFFSLLHLLILLHYNK